MQGQTIDDDMVSMLADQLRVPLVQIQQLMELGGDGAMQSASILSIQSLRAIDAFLLSRDVSELRIEPVAVGAVLYDVAHELEPLAKQYGRYIEIDHRAKYGSLLTNKRHLEYVLGLIGEVLITSPAETKHVVLGSHSSQREVVAGVFAGDVSSDQPAASAQLWHRQASYEIAAELAEQLTTHIRGYRHRSLPGMGVRLTPSRQLRMGV